MKLRALACLPNPVGRSTSGAAEGREGEDASCGLSQFYPRTAGQVEALKAEAVRYKQ